MKCPHCGQTKLPACAKYCYMCGERMKTAVSITNILCANEDHYKIMDKGVTAWNRWRAVHPEITPNLKRKNLSGRDLKKYNFSHAILCWANFENSNCSHCDFRGANLHDADFTKANVTKADFTDANLEDTKFQGAITIGVKLDHAHITRCTSLSGTTKKVDKI